MNVVTGAFGFTGKYIAERLLAQGEPVRTLTRRPERPNPFGTRLSEWLSCHAERVGVAYASELRRHYR